MSNVTRQATRALQAHQAGDSSAASQLLPLVYDKLRALAASYLKGERPDHTLQPTALVHEAYIRLVDVERIDWRGTTHFFAMAATQMRRLLVEHARGANAQKRGGGCQRVTLDEGIAAAEDRTLVVLDLDRALAGLSERNQRQGRVAELRLFAGLRFEEIAHVVGVSERTAQDDWRMARAWLSHELE